ncbi:bifunctional GNAT family N-acetyltransferase/hotdog fold thioesterase [Thaumasiovibrio subtropicus]|uniref:bifunctional GNAT family N-acetyltransferase/hotdog fold thioesterase n=1 Tax=Thaumasiovibrio subtropicus TaxID=1891207 RepID=UPI000B34B038|nr:bifunctional GNAT family N-acetyltransferase/hotdog fold thioesterase [Thaumasiovibrio subtropicus]
MFRLVTPNSEMELEKYYHFRWQMLREPWNMPLGSERDAYDVASHHRMIVDGKGDVVAVGRLYLTPDNDGQIRYMAVSPDYREKGMGTLVLMSLESLACQEGAKRLVCNAREDAIPFYVRNKFTSQGELSDERGPVRHQQMLKRLDEHHEVARHPEWCAELQQRWSESIPISEKMGMKINQYTGYRFEVGALLNANLNPQGTMFAGSIFSMATLAGWGFMWMLMKERGLSGEIMLVDSHIRYHQPVAERPRAVVGLDNMSGDLDRLERGRKVRVSLDIAVYSGDEVVTRFTGDYLILPLQSEETDTPS